MAFKHTLGPSAMVKTNVHIDPALYKRLADFARGKAEAPVTAVVRAAIAEFLDRHAPAPRAE